MTSQKGTLYLIPCPISQLSKMDMVLPSGNLQIINSLDYFIVENVRSARRFLSSLHIERRIDDLEFVELNEHTIAGIEVERMIRPLLNGRSAGVISEAGVPAVADPGQMVVELCHRYAIRVVPLVGPSSILLSVMASGLSGQSFAFNGYLPVKEPERSKAIKKLEARALSEHQSQLFIEAPYRNLKMFEQLLKVLQPKTHLMVASDITSMDEYLKMMRVEQWRELPTPQIEKKPTIFIIG
ncbi:MAG: SAM-dependent methyltransferase [Alistipes sp.]|nr:SAM-dependent methyltransferase [Candidatus Alistipes equi]